MELEKVNNIKFSSRLLNPEETLDVTNSMIVVGILGLLLEFNNQDFNSLATSLFLATITYGAIAGTLLNREENN